MHKDPRVDEYIVVSAEFAKPILKHLRDLVHKACPEVKENIKWGFPHFEYKGILCSMAAFKSHCAFTINNADSLSDPDKILTTVGKTAMGHLGKLRDLKDLPDDKMLIKYLKTAAQLQEAGIIKPKKEKTKTPKELPIPAALAEAFERNRDAQKFFNNFSYSHKKEFLDWINEAKTEVTYNKRIQATIGLLIEGKSKNWKYLSKNK